MNLEERIKKANLTPAEVASMLNSAVRKKKIHINWDNPKVKYGVISDSHIGHSCYDSRIMQEAALRFNREKVDFVIHGGDVCEGHYESKRQGSIFELNIIGGDNQVEAAVKELQQLGGIPIYAITGNHCHNTFFKMAGFDIGKRIAEKMPNFKYLGNMEGFIKLPFGHQIEIMHPDGGSSYAISYRSQKIAESLEGGTKPAVLHIGHYHKAEYLFYRNIHIIQNGTLERQTDFMRGKHLSAHLGYWIINLEVDKRGVQMFQPTFYPFY